MDQNKTNNVTTQKFRVSKIFLNVFERRLLCSPSLYLFDQKYSRNSDIVKHYYNLKCLFSILIYFETKRIEKSWLFSIITLVFRFTWSFRNYSNMLIWCTRKISYYYQCCKELCCLIQLCCCLWKQIYFFSRIFAAFIWNRILWY